MSAFSQLAYSDHVLAIAGLGNSSIDVALTSVAQAQKVTLLESGPPTSLLQAPFVLPYTPALTAQAAAISDYLLSSAARAQAGGVPNVAIVAFDNPAGHSFAAAIGGYVQAGGGTIAGQYFVAPTLTDYTSYAAQIKAAGANEIADEPDAEHSQILMNDLTAIGVHNTLPFAASAFGDADKVPWASYAAVNEYNGTGNSKAALAYQKAAHAAGYDPATAHLIEGYAAGEMLIQGLTSCGWPCSSSKLYSKLQNYTGDLNGLALGGFSNNTSAGHLGPVWARMQLYSASGTPTSKYTRTINFLAQVGN
jgi:ABC-type branched-subunit amino acid transport system substrate-binding protein